jgi:hypothetical protein
MIVRAMTDHEYHEWLKAPDPRPVNPEPAHAPIAPAPVDSLRPSIVWPRSVPGLFMSAAIGLTIMIVLAVLAQFV